MSAIRRLAAIMPADVVGFSRLAGADEDRALKTCNQASTRRRR